MRFSIVIPVYNTEKFLARCLDSVKAQTVQDFEVIVVDDFSPRDGRAGAEEIVGRYDDRFRCVRHERNRSAYQARRTGVAAANGDYLVPVDPDDYLMPETLANLGAAIEVGGPDLISYWIDYDDGSKIHPHWCRHAASSVSGIEALRELVDHKYFTGVASKAFRRETLVRALTALDAPDDLYLNTCDDFLMLVATLMTANRVSFVAYAGYRYFINEKSTSFTWKTRAGFRRAQEQMLAANALLLRMAQCDGVLPEVRTLVRGATDGIASWFAQMRRERSWTYRMARKLLRTFSAK